MAEQVATQVIPSQGRGTGLDRLTGLVRRSRGEEPEDQAEPKRKRGRPTNAERQARQDAEKPEPKTAPKKEAKKARAEPEPEEAEESAEAEPEAKPESKRRAKVAEADADEGETPERVEVSDKIEDLAEQLGWDTDELLSHLTRETDGEGGTKTRRSLSDMLKGHSADGEKFKLDRAEFDTAKQRHEQEAQKYVQTMNAGYQMLSAYAQANLPTEKQLKEFADAGDSLSYNDAKMKLDQHRQTMQGIAQRIQQARQAERQKAIEWGAGERRKALSTVPALADEAKGQKWWKDAKEVLRAVGYSDQEVHGAYGHPEAIYDHRTVRVLDWALKGWAADRAAKKAPEIVKRLSSLPKPVRPGSSAAGRRGGGDVADLESARERLRATGGNSRSALAAVIGARLRGRAS